MPLKGRCGMENETYSILNSLQLEITSTRKQILDLLEMAFGDHPKWQYARSRVLRALGRSGLEGILENALRQIQGEQP